jgi:predicted regulator of Ras-like GTPase activity (Roadblock/LC7/MglB family)
VEFTVTSWFHEITHNPHIDVALLVDHNGRLIATSTRIAGEAQRIASMVKAAEVLARGLTSELGRGDVRSLQLSTQAGHLLALPVANTHYLIVLTGKDAPLELIFTYTQRLIEQLADEALTAFVKQAITSPLDDVDVDELIDAVSEWLHEGGDPEGL